jgi:hypothetical protein
MDMAEAKSRFDRAMGYCDDIVAVHQKSGGTKQGLRTLEPSLNRAVVVLAVAAWQTAVQDFTLAALDHLHPASGGGVGKLIRGQINGQVGLFSTPDAAKSRALLLTVDFDPRPFWSWLQPGGKGVGTVKVTASSAEKQMNDWLRLRHDIAHGHPKLTALDVLESVRQAATAWLATHPNATLKDALNHLEHDPAFDPTLRLKDAKRCVSLFRRLTTLTAKGLIAPGVGPSVW